MRHGRIKKIDPEMAAFAFMALVSGYVMGRIFFRIPQIVQKSPENLLKGYVGIFLEGIQKG